MGNALEAPYEGAWEITLQAQFFSEIAAAGFDSVRIPIRWSAYAAKEPPYQLADRITERVDWAIDQAFENNLVVVINIHHYNEIATDPAGQRARFLAIWQQLAERYRDRPDTLYFEILNEPHDNLSGSAWQSLWLEVFAIIRELNPTRPVIVGPHQWNNIGQLATLDIPDNAQNLIITYHYYNPFQFTHQGASWVAGSNAWLGTEWTGSDAQVKAVQRDFTRAAEWAETKNMPLFMGEFGAYQRGDMESRVRWTTVVREEAEARGFSWAYWEFGAGFGAYDRVNQKWNEPLIRALIPEGVK